MREVWGYLGNQLGFSETGRYVLDNLIKPRIIEIGILIKDPFIECAKELNPGYLETLIKYEDVKRFWKEFSDKITPINNRLMQASDCFLSILDGGQAVDEGLAGEIGYYAAIKQGPIYALRSDIRCGENMAIPINAQIRGYIMQSRGKLIEPPNAIEKWFAAIKEWYDSFIKQPA